MEQEDFLRLLSKKLRNEISHEELDALNRMLKQLPELDSLYQNLAAYFNKKQHIPVDTEQRLRETWAKVDADTAAVSENKGRIAAIPLFLKIAAILLIVVGITYYFFYRIAPGPPMIAIHSGKNIEQVQLPEGTRVKLNKNTVLQYNAKFGLSKRRMVLSGDAFFDVAKNAKIPLVIQAGSTRITVRGTAFNVLQENSTTTIALIRGSVEVTSEKGAGKTVTLFPEQRIVINNHSAVFDYRIDTVSGKVWGDLSEDTLVFNKEPLMELVKKLERRYQVSITIQSAQLMERRFSGTVTTQTVKEVMDALQLSFPFKYTINDNRIVIE